MEIQDKHLSGAKEILRRCLGLSQNQSLVIFIDETTITVGTAIAEAAGMLGIPQTTIFVPISLQSKIPKERDFSLITLEIAREARAILICVNGTPECLQFRDRILESQWSIRTRIGHMPGATLDVLELANVDFDKLIVECHILELAMSRGTTLEFMTFAHDGTSHNLKMDIGGWNRLPVASDGVIEDGVWGNVPSGETYIAPVEETANGSVVINGSVPGLLIQSEEQEIVLYFEMGHLTKIVPPDNTTALWLHQTQIQMAIESQDPNWTNLAEIGIGVNPGVTQLTGNMLFDEKCAGTAHIALGLNAFMGGSVKSVIHCDMVIKGPSISIDGKKILDHGRINILESDWRENYERSNLEDSLVQAAVHVSRSGIEADSYDKRLQRILRSEPGRVSTCFVGDDDTSKLAYILYTNIPLDNGEIPIKTLAEKSRIDYETARRVLHILHNYNLIRLY